ncbi:unnamed protein product, partial [Prorocentrum cordatum]
SRLGRATPRSRRGGLKNSWGEAAFEGPLRHGKTNATLDAPLEGHEGGAYIAQGGEEEEEEEEEEEASTRQDRGGDRTTATARRPRSRAAERGRQAATPGVGAGGGAQRSRSAGSGGLPPVICPVPTP